jgi:hypothetical protein
METGELRLKTDDCVGCKFSICSMQSSIVTFSATVVTKTKTHAMKAQG